MLKWIPSKVPRVALAAAAAIMAASVVTYRVLRASDHQDTPLVEMSPRYDINDLIQFLVHGAEGKTRCLRRGDR